MLIVWPGVMTTGYWWVIAKLLLARFPVVEDRTAPVESVPAPGDAFLANGGTQSTDLRSKPDNVAAGINYGAFVLVPVGVLGHVDFNSDGEPLLGKCIRIINPEIGRVSGDFSAGVRNCTQMNLDVVSIGSAYTPWYSRTLNPSRR